MGLSVSKILEREDSVREKELTEAHPRATIGRFIRFDPNDVLAPTVAPLCQDFPAALQPFSRSTADPQENEARVSSKRRDRQLLKMRPGE